MTTQIEGPMGTAPYAEHEVETGPAAEGWIEGARPFMEALLGYGFFWSWDDNAILRHADGGGPVTYRVLLTTVAIQGLCMSLAKDPRVKKVFAELAATRPDMKEAFAMALVEI